MRKVSQFSLFILQYSPFSPFCHRFSRHFRHYGEISEHFLAIFCHNGENFLPFLPLFFAILPFLPWMSCNFCHHGENGEKMYRHFSPFLLFFLKNRWRNSNEPPNFELECAVVDDLNKASDNKLTKPCNICYHKISKFRGLGSSLGQRAGVLPGVTPPPPIFRTITSIWEILGLWIHKNVLNC